MKFLSAKSIYNCLSYIKRLICTKVNLSDATCVTINKFRSSNTTINTSFL